jgi:hypothetical protein
VRPSARCEAQSRNNSGRWRLWRTLVIGAAGRPMLSLSSSFREAAD